MLANRIAAAAAFSLHDIKRSAFACAGGAALLAFVQSAAAHVSLAQPMAEAGTAHQAVLRIGHGCKGAATTAVAVRIPPGFEAAQPLARPGWKLAVQGSTVTWTASEGAGLPDGERGEFAISGRLPGTPGPLWFKVLQSCGQASLDWSQIPAQGTSTQGLAAPAALLQVMSGSALVQARELPKVEGAWVRSAVPGQQGTGGFMTLTAPEAMQLVGVSTPVGTAEVHEMKMEGDVMRMRAVPSLDLPAGRKVELKPGGYHLMLQNLKQALPVGSTVALTLHLRDAKGGERKLELKLPVAARAPGAAAGAPTGEHKH